MLVKDKRWPGLHMGGGGEYEGPENVICMSRKGGLWASPPRLYLKIMDPGNFIVYSVNPCEQDPLLSPKRLYPKSWKLSHYLHPWPSLLPWKLSNYLHLWRPPPLKTIYLSTPLASSSPGNYLTILNPCILLPWKLSNYLQPWHPPPQESNYPQP